MSDSLDLNTEEESLENLALIILNYNSCDDTLRCVRKLLSFKRDFHIIVVDNMSSDDSYERLTKQLGGRKNVDLIESGRNGGYSFGNNLGMKYAIENYDVKILGILNPDVIIPKIDVLTEMKNALESDPSYGIIGGSMIGADHRYNSALSGWDVPTPFSIVWGHFLLSHVKNKKSGMRMVHYKLAQVGCVTGCFFLAKTHVMQELGFFDENIFLYNEEDILGLKCKRAGYKEVIALDQFYIHNHKYKTNEIIPLKRKIALKKEGYRSRKYICKTYFSARLLPLLWCTEMMNRVYLTGCYVWNLFRRR